MDWMWDKLESGEERKDDSFFIKEVDKDIYENLLRNYY